MRLCPFINPHTDPIESYRFHTGKIWTGYILIKLTHVDRTTVHILCSNFINPYTDYINRNEFIKNKSGAIIFL